MKRVAILILERGLYSTVAGPLKVFQFAGVGWNYLTGQATHPQFQVVTASIEGKTVTGAGGLWRSRCNTLLIKLVRAT
jgi:hypothetical protein